MACNHAKPLVTHATTQTEGLNTNHYFEKQLIDPPHQHERRTSVDKSVDDLEHFRTGWYSVHVICAPMGPTLTTTVKHEYTNTQTVLEGPLRKVLDVFMRAPIDLTETINDRTADCTSGNIMSTRRWMGSNSYEQIFSSVCMCTNGPNTNELLTNSTNGPNVNNN